MFAVLRKEFTRNKTSFVIYCLIAMTFAWMYISLFPSIQEESKTIDALLDSMPSPLMEAFGIEKDSYGKIETYLAIELMTIFWPLLAGILSISRAGSAIAGDIENRTLGIELGLPISRLKVYFLKFFGNWSAIFAFCFISIFFILPVCYAYNIEIDESKIVALFWLSLLFATTIFSFTFLLSSIFSEKGKVFFISGGVLIVSYAANILASLSSNFSWMRTISIYHYFDPLELLSTGTLCSSSALFFAVVILTSIVGGAFYFQRRDISI